MKLIFQTYFNSLFVKHLLFIKKQKMTASHEIATNAAYDGEVSQQSSRDEKYECNREVTVLPMF